MKDLNPDDYILDEEFYQKLEIRNLKIWIIFLVAFFIVAVSINYKLEKDSHLLDKYRRKVVIENVNSVDIPFTVSTYDVHCIVDLNTGYMYKFGPKESLILVLDENNNPIIDVNWERGKYDYLLEDE